MWAPFYLHIRLNGNQQRDMNVILSQTDSSLNIRIWRTGFPEKSFSAEPVPTIRQIYGSIVCNEASLDVYVLDQLYDSLQHVIPQHANASFYTLLYTSEQFQFTNIETTQGIVSL